MRDGWRDKSYASLSIDKVFSEQGRSGQAKADGTLILANVQVAHRTLTFPLTAELVVYTFSNANDEVSGYAVPGADR